ncbi:MAG: hypothetical protein AB7I41_21390 [Candidatus Sericytochromatia bacterium]
MNVPIDEQLLNALTKKTGQSKEVLLAQAAKLIETHFRHLLQEEPTATYFDTDLLLRTAEAVMDDYSEAFHELAR